MSKKPEPKKQLNTSDAKGAKKTATKKSETKAPAPKKESSETKKASASNALSNTTVIEVKPKEKIMTEEELRLFKAARTIQCFWRRYRAIKERLRLKQEKKELDQKLEKLEQEAFIQMVRMEQEREEKKRMKQLKERQMKAKREARRKKFLEAAYDGNLEEMKHLIKDLEKEIDSLDDKLDPARRKQAIHSLIECKDSNNNTALSEASSGGASEVVKFLIVNNSEPNSRGAFSRTPLWRASFGGHLNCVQILLENGADPRLFTNDGQRALDAASKDSVIEVLKNWNIQLTERMLQQIEKTRRELKQEQMQSLESRKKLAHAEFNKVKTQFDAVKTALFKCNEELQRLHDEYLLNAAMYAPLIDKKEGEKSELTTQFESLREQMFKARIAYKDLMSELNKEKRKLKKSKNGLDGGENEEEEDEEGDKKEEKGDGSENEGEEFDEENFIKINIKELDDTVLRDLGGSIQKSLDKWPLIIDQNDQASTFLRYRDTNYVNCLDVQIMQPEKFRLALLGAIRYGKPLVIDFMQYDQELLESLKVVCGQIDEKLFAEMCNKSIVKDEKYMRLVKPAVDGKEYEAQNFNEVRLKRFKVIFLTSNVYPSEHLLRMSLPIKVVNASKKSEDDFDF